VALCKCYISGIASSKVPPECGTALCVICDVRPWPQQPQPGMWYGPNALRQLNWKKSSWWEFGAPWNRANETKWSPPTEKKCDKKNGGKYRNRGGNGNRRGKKKWIGRYVISLILFLDLVFTPLSPKLLKNLYLPRPSNMSLNSDIPSKIQDKRISTFEVFSAICVLHLSKWPFGVSVHFGRSKLLLEKNPHISNLTYFFRTLFRLWRRFNFAEGHILYPAAMHKMFHIYVQKIAMSWTGWSSKVNEISFPISFPRYLVHGQLKQGVSLTQALFSGFWLNIFFDCGDPDANTFSFILRENVEKELFKPCLKDTIFIKQIKIQIWKSLLWR